MKQLRSLYVYSRTVFCLIMMLGLLTVTCVVLEFGEVSTQAQSPCNPETKPPVRSPDSTRPFFRQGDTVYVVIESSINAQGQIDQIWRGLNSWSNVAGIQFTPGPPPVPHSSSDPTIIYFQNANLGRVPYASTSYGGTHGDGSLANATITFNTSARTGETASSPNDGPFYNPSLPGYDTIFQKETEHEIGHPMGLGDALGINGETVMNRSAYDCPNDNCGMKPVEVTPCDKSAAGEVQRVPPPDPGGGFGDGGGGGGGNGDCPCGDCVYGCDGYGGGDGTNCDWISVGGQCWAGVEYYDSYGVLEYSDPPYCEDPQYVSVCW